MTSDTHHQYMQIALQLAERGRYSVSPNPMVGCVIVKDGVIIGRGYHKRAGEPHAEIYALQEAGEHAAGATVYVTLEPCAHHGRTPPCIDALIRARVKTVWVAMLDPNPLTNGKGMTALRASGIQVETGLMAAEARALNQFYLHFIQHRRPFVICKWAMSLDGKTITHANDERDISSEDAKQQTHKLRSTVDAILIGANSLRCDNPALTARLEIENSYALRQPLRIVISASGKLPISAQLFSTHLPGKTIIVTTQQISELQHIEQIILPENQAGRIHIQDLLRVLGKRHITSLLVEGGMQLHQQFISENLVNAYSVYIAPVLIGNLTMKLKLKKLQFQPLGRDLHLTAHHGEHLCLAE